MTRISIFLSTLLILTAVASSNLFAQKQQNWSWQNPLPQGNTIRSSAYPDSNTIVFAGEAGMIMKSIDGGDNWEFLKTGTKEDLYGVSFANVNCGFAVGTNGTIIRTKDCGKTWDILDSGRKDTLRGVTMLSEKIIVAVGDTGTILRSIDGGNTWNYQPFPNLRSNLNDVFAPFGGSGLGFIVGDSFPPFGGPPIIITDDSFGTAAPFLGSFPNLETHSFNSIWSDTGDSAKIILVGDQGTIVSTTKKGTDVEIPISPVTVDISKVVFFTDLLGFATGPGGTLLKTTDCGETWSLVIQPFERDLLTIALGKDSTIYLGGEVGGLIKTPDFGNTFSPVQTGFLLNLTDVAFLDDSFGIASPHRYGVAVGSFGSILRTEDGGNIWEQVPPVTTDPMEAVTAPTKPGFGSKLWMAGGKFGSFGRIYFSEDSAKTWKPQPVFSQFKFFGITFCDSLNGFVVGLGGVIFCTKDGGTTWTQKTSPSNNWLLDVAMPSDSCIFIAGGFGTMLKSRDGGNTWTTQTTNTQEWLTSVAFMDDSFGIATGNHGVILRTQDSGNTWEDISPENITFDFTDVSLFNNQRFANKTDAKEVGVTAVGHNGTIMYSEDGGDTWIEQNSKTNHPLTACFFSDSLNGTAVGVYGTILRTDDKEAAVGLQESSWDIWEAQSPLGLNYPNPVHSTTRIPFSVPHQAPVDLRIFDLSGKMVDRLIQEELLSGSYEYDWTPNNLPNGIYVYRLQIGYKSYSRKLILAR